MVDKDNESENWSKKEYQKQEKKDCVEMKKIGYKKFESVRDEFEEFLKQKEERLESYENIMREFSSSKDKEQLVVLKTKVDTDASAVKSAIDVIRNELISEGFEFSERLEDYFEEKRPQINSLVQRYGEVSKKIHFYNNVIRREEYEAKKKVLDEKAQHADVSQNGAINKTKRAASGIGDFLSRHFVLAIAIIFLIVIAFTIVNAKNKALEQFKESTNIVTIDKNFINLEQNMNELFK